MRVLAFTRVPRDGSGDRPERGRGWRRVHVPGPPPPSRRTEWLALAGFLLLPQLAGTAGAIAAMPGARLWFPSLVQPAGMPPAWLLGPLWTVLYGASAVAAWLVWRSVARAGATRAALRPLRLWGWQLGLTAVWSPVLFGLQSIGLGLGVATLLVAVTGWTALSFRRCHAWAAWLLVPYLAWVCYVAYLNAGLLILNPRG